MYLPAISQGLSIAGMKNNYILTLIVLLFTGNLIGQGASLEDKLTKVTTPEGEVFYEGFFEVLENYHDPSGRKISLHLIVLPALGESKAEDAITFLAGGGVLPASSFLSFFSKAFKKVRQSRDIFLLDQRGTFGSNPLQCDLPENISDPNFENLVKNQIELLAKENDLRHYTTEAAARDLDEIRKWLGYKQLNLFGASYGTKLAQVYAKMFPENVRSLVLHGIVPLHFPMQRYENIFAQLALSNLIRTCEQDSICFRTHPNLASATDSVFNRLEQKAIYLKVESSSELKSFSSFDLRRLLYFKLYTERESSTIPALLSSLNEGDQSILKPYLSPPPSRVPAGVYYCITCTEDFSRMRDEILNQPGGYFSSEWLKVQKKICSLWPVNKPSDSFWEPLKSALPILLLSGEKDHVTPPLYAQEIGRYLPNAKHVVLPGLGHNDLKPCMIQMIQDFIIAGNQKWEPSKC